ncbi:MAG: tetratricopeptide repeat protein [Chromatiales bacterium]|nr:tetratricopeptide repeat protein [Chromatiales bacterium]
MPKFSALTWLVILVAQITYGLMVYAITRSYYEQRPAVATATAPSSPVAPHPMPNPSPAGLTPGMGYTPTMEDLKEEDPALIARLADSYFAQKNYPQAIELYERALTIDPKDVESYNDLGLALFYTGQNEQAVDILLAGIQQDGEFQRIRLSLGFILAQLGDKEGAAAAFKKAIELGAENSVGREAKRMLGEL